MKKALVTGITGQDGSYLAELLLSKGYVVHGIIRRASTFNTQRLDHIYQDPHERKVNMYLHYGDLSDPGLLTEFMYNIKPDEIYHLGAQSHVRVSFDMPEYTGNITGLGTTRLLEAVRRSGINTKFYQASSSELFGSAPPPQNENTAFHPQSPYAIAKLYSYWMTVNYRNAYNLFSCNGILFNHESPRRGETFVTRKITRGISRILSGKHDKLYLGYLDSKRDWGFAPEYVEMMWIMLQQDEADDYVVGTGESHSVRDFLEKAFSYCGVEIGWIGKGVDEKGFIKNFDVQWKNILKTGSELIGIDKRYFRPTDVDYLKADISKARKKLGWEPKVKFSELVEVMMDMDMLSYGLKPKGSGMKAVKEKGLNWTEHKTLNFGASEHER
ncbi:MAG: GDP-mannose 4,6-dehydratase [Ignavibacteria bacterium GWB2_35_12]|nr:MAG: GDP-mannose 4,6-dehydratase [Ignavibacteria bacterium GWA2_35_8]OGU41448.1 MAG: GDP-mannose 4,6-dehydratase [Ignavibacteria bacterium GWB2_35_12]OGU94988.1 MAG: GDP-mannose 4,6-dehydratase [Ignavibacteria bacterium RIFOXYA2_FULL_35_10]OGV19375.1 MAG: GDP-mannose 4,6-dehydratase [Ignavibacteria bacterium RIFOXYC2_FULL_35_21]